MRSILPATPNHAHREISYFNFRLPEAARKALPRVLSIVFILFLGFSKIASGQTVGDAAKDELLWEIAPEMVDGMGKMSDAFDAFEKVYDAMKSIDQGNRPDIEKLEADDWKVLVDACNEATYDIRRAKYATDFNTGPYSMPVEQLKCENKEWIVTRLNLYKDKLNTAAIAGKRDIAKLDKSIEHADKLHQAVLECIKIYQKVLALPMYQEIFVWDWYALESAVRPAVSDYRSELKKHRDKYQKEVDAANRQWSVLSSNIALLEECDKPKQPKPEPEKPVYDYYSGTFGSRRFEMKIKRLGTYYMSGGYVRKYGPAGYSQWAIDILIQNKNAIEIATVLTHSDGTTSRERLKGSFSSDRKKITMNYVSPKYSGTVQVTKQ